MAYAPEVRRTLFLMFVAMVMVAFIVTILGIVGVVPVPERYLDKMFYALVVEIIGAAVAIFQKGAFLEGPEVERDLKKYQPSAEAKKLLATLWKYQLGHAGRDMHSRWLMGLPPTSSGTSYPMFYRGLAELLDVGLAEVARSQLMVMLSNDAFAYCWPISDELIAADCYHFESHDVLAKRIAEKLA